MVIFFHFSLGLGMGTDINLYPLQINIIHDNFDKTKRQFPLPEISRGTDCLL